MRREKDTNTEQWDGEWSAKELKKENRTRGEPGASEVTEAKRRVVREGQQSQISLSLKRWMIDKEGHCIGQLRGDWKLLRMHSFLRGRSGRLTLMG